MQLLLHSFAFLKLLSHLFLFYPAYGQIVTGSVFIYITGLCLTLLFFSKNQIKFSKLALVIIALFMIGFLMVPVSFITNNIIYFNYVAGDAILIFYLIIILLIFLNFKGYIKIDRLKNFLIYIVIIDLFGWILNFFYFGILISVPISLFAYTLSIAFLSKNIWIKSLSLFFAITFIMVNFLAWSRANSISFLLLFLFTFLVYINKNARLKFILTFSLILSILVTLNNPVIQNFYGSRTFKMFSNIISGQIDLSIRERFNEIESTYKTMVDISPTTFVVGLGHGAVWNAKNYPGDLRSLSRNLTKEGYIHNIHIGPVLLIFRYGLFGLLMFFCLIYTVGKSIIYIKNNIKIIINDQQREAIMILFFTTNVLIVALLNFLTKNILIDPLFGFSLGLNILIFKKLKYFRIKNLGLV